MVTVVFLVALRLTIGWHFLYEGVWKIKNAETFSAAPFLTQAKGPAAPWFYAMLPDRDGRQRLGTRTVVRAGPLIAAWGAAREGVERRYQLDQLQKQGSWVIFWDYQEKLEAYLRGQNQGIVDFLEGIPAPTAGSGTALPDRLVGWLAKIREFEDQYYQDLGKLVGQSGASFPRRVPGADVRLPLDAVVQAGTVRGLDGEPILVVEEAIPGWEYTAAWRALKNDVLRRYRPSAEQRYRIQELYQKYKDAAEEYLAAHREFIEAHFQSVERFRQAAGQGGGAPYQRKRNWERRQELRREVNEWLSELDGMGEAFRLALWELLDDDQRSRGGMIAEAVPQTDQLPVSLPGIPSRTELLDALVMYGVTAIGLCLMAGFCTRLAFLGGGLFLGFIILTQPAWPSIYPPAPGVTGHALIVDKNFVEMIACFALATTAVGRWGGLDFFLYRWFFQPIVRRFREEGQEEAG